MVLGINKTFLSTLAMGGYIVLLLGSAGSPQHNAPVETLKIGNYDFTPSPIEKPNSAGITFALVNPNFISGFKHSEVQVFKSFVKGMQGDFEELLVARGYALRGPFPSRDEMVYSDKEQSDLALTVGVDIDIQEATPRHWVQVFSLSEQKPYRYVGTLVLSGKVNLEVFEPTTGEKLQVKSISLPQINVDVKSVEAYYLTGSLGLPIQDVGISNPLTSALEGYYKTIMQTAWGHLDVNEMRVLVKQSKQIKGKANFKR